MTCIEQTCVVQHDRCMVRGASDIIHITVTVDGAVQDITGWTLRYTVRKTPPASNVVDDTDAEISAIAVLTDPVNGKATFNIPPEDTRIPIGEHYYDIKTEDTAGVESIPVGGTLTVDYSITQDS